MKAIAAALRRIADRLDPPARRPAEIRVKLLLDTSDFDRGMNMIRLRLSSPELKGDVA